MLIQVPQNKIMIYNCTHSLQHQRVSIARQQGEDSIYDSTKVRGDQPADTGPPAAGPYDGAWYCGWFMYPGGVGTTPLP